MVHVTPRLSAGDYGAPIAKSAIAEIGLVKYWINKHYLGKWTALLINALIDVGATLLSNWFFVRIVTNARLRHGILYPRSIRL